MTYPVCEEGSETEGTWSGVIGCVTIDDYCGTYTTNAGYMIDECDDHRIGSTCSLTCSYGYSNVSTITNPICQSNGHWSVSSGCTKTSKLIMK